MSTGCTVRKTISGKAEIIYEKIVYLKRELEKRGLKVEIIKKNEILNNRYNISGNEQNIFNLSNFFNKYGIFNNNYKDPTDITQPYKRFAERISGGGIIRYETSSIEIEIEIN
jgi:hypothetical protein